MNGKQYLELKNRLTALSTSKLAARMKNLETLVSSRIDPKLGTQMNELSLDSITGAAQQIVDTKKKIEKIFELLDAIYPEAAAEATELLEAEIKKKGASKAPKEV